MKPGTLGVQWLRLCASTAVGMGLMSGQGTKILPACCMAIKLKKKKRNLCFVVSVFKHKSP